MLKLTPYKHQAAGIERLQANPEYFALGAEMGTGKTLMILADAAHQWSEGEITGLFVVAPKGVHANWILRECPKTLDIPWRGGYWKSGAGIRWMRELEKLMKPDDGLTILTMNIDGVNTKKGLAFARRFLKWHKCMLVVDESQRIKNPSSKRTKRVKMIAHAAVSRRIASGTLIPNSPIDVFSQYDFLAPNLLGTTSYRTFVAEYAELLHPQHPVMVEALSRNRFGDPIIIARDEIGNPIYKNLDKLSRLMSPYTYRVTKAECLDLPDKIYQVQPFELSPAQMRLYRQVRDEMRYQRDDGQLDIYTALTIIGKLRQITSGFIMVDGEPTELLESKPRLDAMMEALEDAEGQVIIWSTYREEIRQIVERIGEENCVQYHGGVGAKDREAAIDRFQSGDVRCFIANPAAGGTGLTLTAAQTVIYHSCDYNLEHRLQSEDRCHRIGTEHHVVYIDLTAIGTIDERIAASLQNKEATALQVLDAV